MTALSERLHGLRTAKRLTREEVAAALEVGLTTLYWWESGRSIPNLENGAKLASFYGVSVDWLLGGEKRVAEDRAGYLVEEAEVSLRAAAGELPEEGLREIVDYIRFKRQQGRRARPE